MDFANFINKASRLYNKILMLLLGIIIFTLFILTAISTDPTGFTLTGSRGLTLLVLWSLFSLISLLYTVNGVLLNSNFKSSVTKQKQKGKPVEGIRGFEDFQSALKGARNFSILVTLTSIISLLIFIIAFTTDVSAITTEGGQGQFRLFLSALAVTFAFITISVLFLVDYPEETSFSPGGLIGFYEPDTYPMTLDNLLSDVFITYLDPATYIDIDEWTMDVVNRLSDDFEADEDAKTRMERARERILLLLYLKYSNPDIMSEEVFMKELVELVGTTNVDPLINGDETGLSFDEITKILIRIEKMSPEPFRLIDRLMVNLTDDYKVFSNNDLYFTVAARSSQGSIKESSGVIAFFLNNTERTDRELLVELHGGIYEIHPHDQKIKLKLDPLTDPYPDEQPPIVSDDGEDIIGILTDLLQIGDAIWFRFKPSSFGYKVITVQAEEEQGRVMGSSIEIKFTKSLSFYAKTYLPKLSGAAGFILPAITAAIGLA